MVNTGKSFMSKIIINLAVILIIGFFNTQSYASKSITLNPNETKLFANNSLWTVNATCTVEAQGQKKNKIKIHVLKNKGTINGKNLSSGQATSFTVKNNSNIAVSAEAGTQIHLINLGNAALKANCSS
jgi:hypothetical protein